MPSVSLLSLSEMDERAQGIRWLVKGAIPAGSMGLLWGGTGSFKTFVALDLALHIAYGLSWLGLKTVKTSVLYCAFEGGLGLTNRIKSWHVARGMDWRKCPMKVVIDPLALRQDAGVLSKALESAEFVPGVIFGDTFSQTYSGDENDASEVASFFRVLVAAFIARFGATLIMIHHAGHANTDRPRGSSAILANVDFIYGIFRSEGAPLATLENTKQKDGSILPPVAFKLDSIKLGVDEDGDNITSLAATHIADPKALAATVGAGPEGPKRTLLEVAALGLPVAEARKKFYAASDADTIEAKKKQWQRTLAWSEQSNLVQIIDGLLQRVTV